MKLPISLAMAALLAATLVTVHGADPQPQPQPSAPVLPGILAADVYLSLQQRGFSMTRDFARGDNGADNVWQCRLTEGGYSYSVEIFGGDPAALTAIRATVVSTGGANLDAAAAEFLGYIASAPIAGIDPVRARAWVRANLRGRRIVSHGVCYQTFSSVGARMLRISPAAP